MDCFIVTGASRGLGNSICRFLARKDRSVICMSRKANLETLEALKAACTHAEWIEADFLEPEKLEQELLKALSKLKFAKSDRIVLVNNAGRLLPIGELAEAPPAELSGSLSINLVAPLVLTKAVLNYAIAKKLAALIVNISSPSAEKPRAHWIAYGLAKCGLNYLTSAIPVEYGKRREISAISVYPGIMDTDMRKENLAARPFLVKALDWFKYRILRMKGPAVISPDEAARKIVDAIDAGSFKNGAVLDVQRLP